MTLGSVIAHVERVFDDAADQLRRKDVGEFRGEGCGERVEVVALVSLDAARRDHFPDVRVGRSRGKRGAGADQNWQEVDAAGVSLAVFD